MEHAAIPALRAALAANPGFVPIALSTRPGSEVQRPLASVVIGGRITSTRVTFYVLPALRMVWVRWRGAGGGACAGRDRRDRRPRSSARAGAAGTVFHAHPYTRR